MSLGQNRYGFRKSRVLKDTFSFSKFIAKTEQRTRETMENFSEQALNLLNRQAPYGNARNKYKSGEGMLAYDHHRPKSRINEKRNEWTRSIREYEKKRGGSTIGIKLTNIANYAVLLYSDKPSEGHKSGWRSDHRRGMVTRKKYYYTKDGRKVKNYNVKRDTQITAQRWQSFKEWIFDDMKNNIYGDIRGAYE